MSTMNRDIRNFIIRKCGKDAFSEIEAFCINSSSHNQVRMTLNAITRDRIEVEAALTARPMCAQISRLSRIAGTSYDVWGVISYFQSISGMPGNIRYLDLEWHYFRGWVFHLLMYPMDYNYRDAFRFATNRRRNFINLKATLAYLMMRGQLTRGMCLNASDGRNYWDLPEYSGSGNNYCENRVAEEYDGIFANQVYLLNYLRYNGFCVMCLFNDVWMNLKVRMTFMVEGIREWQLLCAILEILFAVISVYFLILGLKNIKTIIFKIWGAIAGVYGFFFPTQTLKSEEKEELFIYNDEAYKRVLIEDRVVYIKYEPKKVSVDEMALPGSSYYPCVKFPTGCLLLSSENTELAKYASFFRISDFLITAKHVAYGCSSSLFDVYATGVIENLKKNCTVNMKGCYRLDSRLFADDNNSYSGTLDVFAVKMPKSFWSKMSMRSAVIGPSYFNQNIQAVGFHNGVVMASIGRVLNTSTYNELQHTASTERGYSGSPLYAGGKTIAMHVRTDGTDNVAIRIEHIIHYLPKEMHENVSNTSSVATVYGYKQDKHKFKGRDVEFFDEEDDTYTLMDKRGGVYMDFDDDDMDREFPSFSKNKYREERSTQDQLLHTMDKKTKRWADYDDENCPLPAKAYSTVSQEKPSHVAAVKKENEKVKAFLAENIATLDSFGYKPEMYVSPLISVKTTDVSLKKHLELFHERNSEIKTEPTLSEKERCAQIVLKQLVNSRFTPKVGYKSPENIDEIISSSIVQAKKSPGFPFLDENLNDNAAVLNKYGNAGLRNLVLSGWNEPFVGKAFIKNEPTKPKKIEKGMPRIIVGNPVTKMVKHAAISKELAHTVVDVWKSSPVKYTFAPNKPGHCEHMNRFFKNREVFESDKSTWDYNCFQYVFDICERVVIGLAVKDIDMSDEEFDEWKLDVSGMFKEMTQDFVYRSATGECIKATHNGIMKSGWFLTILINSVAQLVVNNLVLMRLNLEDETILSKDYSLIVGGDDVLQTFPKGFDTEEYRREAAILGFKLDEFKKHDSLDGAEFFSQKFKVVSNAMVEYHPCNFAKCVANMVNTKQEDLAMALSSHMINYCFNAEKFAFFQKMFMTFRKENAALFPLNLYRDRADTIYMVKGFETNGKIQKLDNFWDYYM